MPIQKWIQARCDLVMRRIQMLCALALRGRQPTHNKIEEEASSLKFK